MNVKASFFASVAALTLMAGGTAMAQAAPAATAPAASASANFAAGAKVLDTKGGEVGTVESVNGDIAVVNTGTHKVSIPIASFGAGDKGPILSLTRAELDAQAGAATAQQSAAFKSSLAPGMAVSDSQGGAVGTIKEVDAQFATIDTTKAQVKLPLSALGQGANGVVIGMTRVQLEAAAQQAAPAAAPASTPAAEPDDGTASN